MIRVRRVGNEVSFLRRYEIEVEQKTNGREGTTNVTLRRGAAVRRLEKLVGIGDAWSFLNAANRRWSEGDRNWAVEYDPPSRR